MLRGYKRAKVRSDLDRALRMAKKKKRQIVDGDEAWRLAIEAMDGHELDTVEFEKAFRGFVVSRVDIGHPMTPGAIRLVIRKCEGYGHDDAICSIERSIESGWRTVFPVSDGEWKRKREPERREIGPPCIAPDDFARKHAERHGG